MTYRPHPRNKAKRAGAKTVRTLDALGLGIMPLDILFTINLFPEPGGKLDATSMILQGGGPVPNVMVGLARFGLKTAVITAVGDDYAGEIGLREIAKDHVRTDWVIVKRGEASDTAIGFVEEQSGRRTIALHRGAWVKPRDVRTDRLPIPRLLHLDGRDLEACMKLARWGRKVGAIVTFDIGSMRNDVSPIFPLVDHLIVADSYAFPFTGTNSAPEAIGKLSKHCKGTIVVTEGIAGSTGFENGALTRFRSFKVTNVDTTGAGDAFHTGYFFALLKGKPMVERLRLGAATAALKCTRPGARTGIPTLAQVMNFLRKDPEIYA
ncbi:MAG: carbohydrate kinase family protein [candidate division Zixibacteria bacterium]|nr:carbohydrate kinase family protein [candidate division Zixibacteria bacterium]